MQKTASSSTLGPDGLNIAQSFFKPIQGSSPPPPISRNTKISVIGVGNVGMAIAQTILTQGLVDEISLVDINVDKLRGEMLDLQHAAAFLPRTKISASVDYSSTVGSDLVIVTAGARQISGESRLNLLQRNLSLFKKMIPPLAEASPESIILVVSNPVDVLTYVAWKLSGFPSNRVIGSGTNLDSSRFRFLIADHLDLNAHDVQVPGRGESDHVRNSISSNSIIAISFAFFVSYANILACNLRLKSSVLNQIDPDALLLWSLELLAISVGTGPFTRESICWYDILGSMCEVSISCSQHESSDQAYIVGEHGDSSVALWSSISVGGVPILSFLERQQIAYEKHMLEKIHKEVVQGAYEVIKLKGYTSWAIGYSVASLARSILRDQRSIHPVSVLAKGFHGIHDGEAFLSLPAQLGRSGVLGVTNVHLTEDEAKQLRESAKTILDLQSQLEI
ncbi:lactate dehydrogenase/glycoside hydrolase, family 4 protein [Tanacetum coccineum]